MSLFDRCHCRSRLFSLIGRPVRLQSPITIDGESVFFGIIVSKIEHRMRFGVRLNDTDTIIYLDRAEFILPPLQLIDRQPEWVSDNFEGFVYANVEGF